MLSTNSILKPTVIIIGAGIIGMMACFYIKKRFPHAKIIMLEKGDHVPYKFGTSSRSAACSRQQWALEISVAMSIFSTRFYEIFGRLVGEDMPMFRQRGYLFLYQHEDKWQAAMSRVDNQHQWNLREAECLSAEDVKRRFPFAYTGALLGATFCRTDGILDAGIIISALRDWLKVEGVQIYTKTEAVSFQMIGPRVCSVQTARGTSRECLPSDYLINCSGPWAARIGKMLGTRIPVAPEKRYLWNAVFRDIKDQFPQTIYNSMPFIVCNDKEVCPYVKPEPVTGGNIFTVGCEHKVCPSFDFADEDQEKVDPIFEVNIPGGYHEKIWEILTKWLPFTELWGFRSKVHAGFYETTPTNSPIIGFDPNYENVIHCVGFSGHGVMHGPAAGVTVADLLSFGCYREFPNGEQHLSYQSLVDGTRPVEAMKI